MLPIYLKSLRNQETIILFSIPACVGFVIIKCVRFVSLSVNGDENRGAAFALGLL